MSIAVPFCVKNPEDTQSPLFDLIKGFFSKKKEDVAKIMSFKEKKKSNREI